MKILVQITLIVMLVLLMQACIPGPTPAPATATVPPAATATTLPPATEPPPTQPPATAPPATAPPATEPPAPTGTSAPPPPTAPPPATATTIPTPPGLDVPEAILIQQPGPGSRVTSPVRVAGTADPTFEQSLAVVILTADGTPLATASTQIGADVGQRGPFEVEVPFTTTQEQQGFIQVYAQSARDGGVTHLASVGVVLLPGGTAVIETAVERPEQIIILQPQMAAVISGGVAHVEGFGLASFEQTFVVDILDENGTVIASAPVTVTAPDVGQPGPFSIDLPYSVSGPMPGRVQVRDVSPAHGGNSHLSSVEVQLEP